MGTSAHPSAWSCWTKRTSWSLTHRLASSVTYIAQLMEHDKKFVVIGNQNAVTYKEVFPLIKENRIWLGCYSGNMEVSGAGRL